MALDEKFIIDSNKVAYEELKREFKGVSFISDDDIKEILDKNIYYRQFDATIVQENNKLFELLNTEKTLTYNSKNQIYNIISLIDKFLSQNNEYPRRKILLNEKEVLNRFLNENNKNIFKQQSMNIDFTLYDELVISLSAIFKANSLVEYIYLINDTKNELYQRLANILRNEESEEALDIEYDLSNNSKINNYTISAFRICFKNPNYPRVPNVLTIAPDVMIEAFKEFDGTEDIRSVILKHVKKYILDEKEKSKNDTENDKIVKEYVFAAEDSIFNPELKTEAFKKYRDLVGDDESKVKDVLTREQQLMVSRNDYEYNTYGWQIQQKILKLRNEAKILKK